MNVLLKVLLILAATAGASAARTILEPSIQKFDHPTWVRGSRVNEKDTIDITFVVKTDPVRRAALEEKFWAVSNPFGPEYKKYLSREEIIEILHPVPTAEGETLASDFIARYLSNHAGVDPADVSITYTRDMVSVKMNALKAETLFNTELYHWKPEHEAFGEVRVIRAGAQYSLPDELAERVAIVEKLVRLPRMTPRDIEVAATPKLRGQKAESTDPFSTCSSAKQCVDATTPEVLRERYGFPVSSSYYPGNSMAVAEFEFQGVDTSDLNNFAKTCGVSHVQVDTTTGSGGGAVPGVEALLDVEYIEAVAAPIPLQVINSVSYSLFDWSQNLNNSPNPAWVQSVSYGNDEVQQTSTEYMYECNTQFMMNGARGLSVLFASGDQGVWGRTGHSTLDGPFNPDFPAASPYVTAVGGTQFLVKSTIGDETAWADGGGGFSNTFPTPAYQQAAVEAYLNSGITLPNPNQYNVTGRAYPDVSALAGTANGYCVAYKGTYGKVGGTSAACPVFAGAIALINDNLLAAGQQPMGYLNQWIYGIAGPSGVFNDVTTGTNNEDYGNGFTATTGWDPATGYGTPNYPAMLELVMGSVRK